MTTPKVDPLAVVCPTCGAEPSVRCWSGTRRGRHLARGSHPQRAARARGERVTDSFDVWLRGQIADTERGVAEAIIVRALAKVAAAEHFRASSPRLPSWIAQLTYGDPQPTRALYDRLIKRGLVSIGAEGRWKLTGTGWQVLNAHKPKEDK